MVSMIYEKQYIVMGWAFREMVNLLEFSQIHNLVDLMLEIEKWRWEIFSGGSRNFLVYTPFCIEYVAVSNLEALGVK